jgi:hypothetical protein
MLVHLHMTCVYHQPFKVRLIYQGFQYSFPHPFVPPAAKASVGVFPIAEVRRQVPPRSSSPENPEHCVYELAVVAGIAAPSALVPKQVGLQDFPGSV